MKLEAEDFRRLLWAVCSAFVYSIAVVVFVDSGNLFPGGFAGLSYLIIRIFSKYLSVDLPFGVVYLILNVFPTILVFRYVGKRFTIFSILQYSLVSLFTALLPRVQLTTDPLLIAVFGGLIAGFGISIALQHGFSSGGTDFLAVYYANKYNRSTWNYILFATAGVLALAGALFGWNTALYSIIYQFCNTQVVSARHNRYKLNTLLMITRKPREVSEMLIHTVRHGITILHGEGGYEHHSETVLIMTINSYQVDELIKAAQKADPRVFISIQPTDRIVGNYYQVPLE